MVLAARRRGDSWAVIGRLLGRSRQALQQRVDRQFRADELQPVARRLSAGEAQEQRVLRILRERDRDRAREADDDSRRLVTASNVELGAGSHRWFATPTFGRHRAPVVSRSVADPTSRGAFRPTGNPIRAAAAPPIDLRVALITFVVSWAVAQVVSSVVLAALGGGTDVADVSIGVLGASLAAAWVCYLVGMWIASDQVGTGRFADDYGLGFRPIDLIGVGIGVLSQLVVVNLVYLPLQWLWPDTFTDDRLQENAKELIDRATGGSAVLLVVLVGVGAPIVEELFYRGLLQRSLLARYSAGSSSSGWRCCSPSSTSASVEYPGLFVFGLILGFCAMRTGRLGMSIGDAHRLQRDRADTGLVSETVNGR